MHARVTTFKKTINVYKSKYILQVGVLPIMRVVEINNIEVISFL